MSTGFLCQTSPKNDRARCFLGWIARLCRNDLKRFWGASDFPGECIAESPISSSRVFSPLHG